MKEVEKVANVLKGLGYEIRIEGDSVFYIAFNDNGTVNRVVEIDCTRKASRYKVDVWSDWEHRYKVDVWSDWEQWTDDEWEFEWEEI